MKRVLWFVSFLLAYPLFAVAPATAQEGLSTLEDVRNQGLLYHKKKRSKQALKFLDRAYLMPGGKEDFKTVYTRGLAAHDELFLEVAFQMANEAEKLAGDDKKLASRVLEFQTELKSLYGRLNIKPAKGETNRKGRVFLESSTGIINKKKKEVFEKLRARFRATEIEIPATIYLPHGNFLANNVPVNINSAEAANVSLYLQVERKKEDDTKKWWVIGAGASAAIAVGIGAILLSDEADPKVEQRLIISPANPGGL